MESRRDRSVLRRAAAAVGPRQFLEPTCEFLQRELVLGAGAVARAARAAQAEFVSAPHPKAVDGRH